MQMNTAKILYRSGDGSQIFYEGTPLGDLIKGNVKPYGIRLDKRTWNLQPTAKHGSEAYFDQMKLIFMFEGRELDELEKIKSRVMSDIKKNDEIEKREKRELKNEMTKVIPIKNKQQSNNSDTQDSKGRPKKSMQLLGLLEQFELCKCKGKPYLVYKNEVFEIGGTQYKDFISRLYYMRYGAGLTDNQIKETVLIQRGQALFEADERMIYFRSAGISETLTYLDLADGNNTIIKITPEGWSIADNSDVLFFRPANIRALPMPEKPGDISLLHGLLNLKNDNDFILIRSALTFMLRGRPCGRGSYLIIGITGAEGSAKSTFAKIIKHIVDPGTPETRTPTNDIKDLFIGASRCHVLSLDNISHVSRDLSDSICSLVTGGGFARKLNYSDSEEMIFENCNPIIMNGISYKTAPDLTSRSIDIELEPISNNERKTEEEIWRKVSDSHPQILGGLLTALSNAMKEYKTGFDTPSLPRLADYGKFSIALERGNGWKEGETLEALQGGYDSALESMADDNVLVGVLVQKLSKLKYNNLFTDGVIFNGTSKALLDLLESVEEIRDESDESLKTKMIKEVEQLKRNESWPKSSARLGGTLPRLYNVLKSKGVTVSRGEGRERRHFKIKYDPERVEYDEIPL